MNTDFLMSNEILRDNKYKKNSNGIKSHYSDSCDTIGTFAKEQNTLFNPLTNQILYGINTNMHVLGVSDGTCDQINPTIYTPNYICGTGTAGANRCYSQLNSKLNSNQIENFNAEKNNINKCNGCNVTIFIICIILILLLIGIYYKVNKKKLNLSIIE